MRTWARCELADADSGCSGPEASGALVFSPGPTASPRPAVWSGGDAPWLLSSPSENEKVSAGNNELLTAIFYLPNLLSAPRGKRKR